MCTDACRTGAGCCFQNDWFYANWESDYSFANNMHINELETFSVVLAAIRWANHWRNKRVVIFSDNMTTVGCINKGTSKNRMLMSDLRRLFLLSALHNLPGKETVLVDSISRLHKSSSFVYFSRYCLPAPLLLNHLKEHMSNKTLSFLLCRHIKHQ